MQTSDVINTRTGVGAGIGAIVGFAFGGPIGAGAGAILGGAVARASGEAKVDKGVITPRRKIIFARAMEKVGDPVELDKLADAFAGEGLSGYAALLHRRAELRKLPPEVQAKRRAAYRKAMASDNPDAILPVAKAFENAGALDAAKNIRDHADAVRAAHAAGKSAKPMTGGTVAQFADKLGKALINFGPTSNQAKSAARNLIQARGKTPTDALIMEVIRIACGALKIEVPAEKAEESAAQEAAAQEAAPPPEEESPQSQSQEAAPEESQAAAPVGVSPPMGAAEPTIMGPPAPVVEAPVIGAEIGAEGSASIGGTGAPTEIVAELVPSEMAPGTGGVAEAGLA